MGVVDLCADEGAGDIEALGGYGLLLAFDDFGEGVVDGEVHGGVELGRAADGEERAAVFDELLELRDGFIGGDAA